ncbi:hypothetical protein K432DRAFT_420849 [Lepidopterella palustris CBS 459.81]|uniref:Homing endonuclease LAGLIDADG domain-containing protein n=1 Tax=Lepidopterella palustris CBS 459.81 TaxID=1314670 RepID=A0A8E2DX01_9PEZI|nr:hypothetical protein K432DRAFT_420849 [Lepidopterella palustris CBS 459.81]
MLIKEVFEGSLIYFAIYLNGLVLISTLKVGNLSLYLLETFRLYYNTLFSKDGTRIRISGNKNDFYRLIIDNPLYILLLAFLFNKYFNVSIIYNKRYTLVTIRLKTKGVYYYTIIGFKLNKEIISYFKLFPLFTKANLFENKEGLAKIKVIQKQINLNNSITNKIGSTYP